MREIKFRGKRIDGGHQWVFGNLALCGKGLYKIQAIETDEHGVEIWIDEDVIDQKTVGQFTGLLDRDGVEIYEGDILDDPDYDKVKYVIEFDSSMGGFFIVGYGIRGCMKEYGFDEDGGGYGELDREAIGEWPARLMLVIGNIHNEEAAN